MKPQRIQLSRRAGFNLQEVSKDFNGLTAVNCARPSAWGNRFIIGKHGTREECVNMHAGFIDKGLMRIKIKSELRGKNLACWCRMDECCHVDNLLKMANG